MAAPNPADPAATEGRRGTRQALAGLAAIGLACGGVGQAGPLPDPTRPPSGQTSAAPTGNPAPGLARPGMAAANPNPLNANTSRGAAAAPPASAAPVLPAVLLQSLQAPARGSAAVAMVAMVNGQLVKAGDSVAGRLVVAIDSQGVLLRSPAGDERLWLLGQGSKQAAGSIQGTRSTQYTPAPRAGDTPADGEPPPRAERNAPPGALSLAGRTSP